MQLNREHSSLNINMKIEGAIYQYEGYQYINMKVPSMWNQYLVCPDKTLQRLQQVRNDNHDHFIVDVDVDVDVIPYHGQGGFRG